MIKKIISIVLIVMIILSSIFKNVSFGQENTIRNYTEMFKLAGSADFREQRQIAEALRKKAEESAQQNTDANSGTGTITETNSGTTSTTSTTPSTTSSESGDDFDILGLMGSALDGVIGLLFMGAKILVLITGKLIELVLDFIVGQDWDSFSLVNILFYQATDDGIKMLDPNIFEKSDSTDMDSLAGNIRKNVAIWFTSLRNIAIAVLVIIAVYIGIRMILATSSEKQANYKEILLYWVQSISLLFVLHIIIMLILYLNDSLVKTLFAAGEATTTGIKDITDGLWDEAFWSVSFVKSFGLALAYLSTITTTFLFFLSYLNRLLYAIFYIVISPLITITYSIDKIKDGKSQALDNWLREFVGIILIQPFHCVTYLAIGGIGYSLLSSMHAIGSFNIGQAFVGVIFIAFILKSEDIIKSIFGIASSNVKSAITNMALVSVALNKSKKVVNLGSKVSSGYKSALNNGAGAPGGAPSVGPRVGAGGGPAGTGGAGGTGIPGGPGGALGRQGGPANGGRGQNPRGANGNNGGSNNPRRTQNNSQGPNSRRNNNNNNVPVVPRTLTSKDARNVKRGISESSGLQTALKMAGYIVGAGLTLPTMDPSSIIAGGLVGGEVSSGLAKSAVVRANRQNLAGAYDDVRKADPSKNEDYYKDLTAGNIQGKSQGDVGYEEEQEFLKYANQYKDFLEKYDGIRDEEEITNAMNGQIDKMEAGKVSKHMVPVRAAIATADFGKKRYKDLTRAISKIKTKLGM